MYNVHIYTYLDTMKSKHVHDGSNRDIYLQIYLDALKLVYDGYDWKFSCGFKTKRVLKLTHLGTVGKLGVAFHLRIFGWFADFRFTHSQESIVYNDIYIIYHVYVIYYVYVYIYIYVHTMHYVYIYILCIVCVYIYIYLYTCIQYSSLLPESKRSCHSF